MMNIKRFFIVEFAVYIFLDMIEMFNKESSVELIINGPPKTSVMVLSYNIKIFIYFVSHQILSKVQCYHNNKVKFGKPVCQVRCSPQSK